MPPKSFKVDGTPKKRWSSSDRAARGHSPRRSGGVPRSTGRDEPRRDRRTDPNAGEWSQGRTPRDDRPARETRTGGYDDRRPGTGRPGTGRNDDRPAAGRGDRPVRGDRDRSSTDRPAYDRGTRPARDSRPSFRTDSRDERPARDTRPSFRSNDRDDRPSFRSNDRDDRPSFRSNDRDDRPSFRSNDRDRPTQDDRPSYRSYDRTDRPARDDRPSYRSYDRNDRPARDDRPSYRSNDRNDRPARDERPSYRSDDRPSYRSDDRDDRSSRTGDRTERPSWSRDDRPAAKRRTPPDRAERPSRAAREYTRDIPPRDDRPLSVRTAHVQDDQAVTPVATATPVESGDFSDLGVPDSLVVALRAEGITAPFPIQVATIPDAIAGRDVLGRGQTGSGKTLAFGLPMIATLAGSNATEPRGLVLVPTRELAMQVTDVLTPLARIAGLSVTLVAGGLSYTPQLRAFQRGVDIVVATPGRLIDLMDQGAVDLTRTEITVLDEADHMADLGFLPAVTQILDVVPAGGQRLLFSATLDHGIDRLVSKYLQDPATHEVDTDQASVTTMSHHLINVAPKNKALLTAEIASRPGRTLVFVRTQRGADRVAEQLRESGVMAGALHGGLTQGARTRILSVFKDGELPVLVATDVAARGIHVDEIGLVLQVDPPGGPKEYLHRAGRTARAGVTGTVITLVLPHQRRDLTRLTSQAGVHATLLTGEPGAPEVAELTGARAPGGEPVSEAAYQRLVAPPAPRRRSAAERPWGRSGSGQGRGGRDGDSRGGQRPSRSSRPR